MGVSRWQSEIIKWSLKKSCIERCWPWQTYWTYCRKGIAIKSCFRYVEAHALWWGHQCYTWIQTNANRTLVSVSKPSIHYPDRSLDGGAFREKTAAILSQLGDEYYENKHHRIECCLEIQKGVSELQFATAFNHLNIIGMMNILALLQVLGLIPLIQELGWLVFNNVNLRHWRFSCSKVMNILPLLPVALRFHPRLLSHHPLRCRLLFLFFE